MAAVAGATVGRNGNGGFECDSSAPAGESDKPKNKKRSATQMNCDKGAVSASFPASREFQQSTRDSVRTELVNFVACTKYKGDKSGCNCFHHMSRQQDGLREAEYLDAIVHSRRDNAETGDKDGYKRRMQALFLSSVTNDADAVMAFPGKKFLHDWKVGGMSVCVRCFEFACGATQGLMSTISGHLREHAKSTTSVYGPPKSVRLTLEQTEEVFSDRSGGERMTAKQVKELATIAHTSNRQMHARQWLMHKVLTADGAIPDEDESYELPESTKKSVFRQYEEQNRDAVPPVSLLQYSEFLDVWNKLLPVKVRTQKFCGKLGKCIDCALKDKVWHSGEPNAGPDYEELSKAHRSLFGQSHALREYQETLARQRPNRVLTITLDIAEQQEHSVPFTSTQKKLGAVPDSQIVGVREINFGIWAFVFTDWVRKSGNLICQVILHVLEAWTIRHGHPPDEFYVWVDGGSENANRWVILLHEWIAVKRLVSVEVWYNRSVAGHGHSPLDGSFGNISGAILANVPVYTYEETDVKGRSLREILGTMTTHVEMVLWHVVHDFKAFFDRALDLIKMKDFCSGDDTQHHFRFRVIEPCAQFPTGVQTMFRKCAGDVYCELLLKEKAQCVTPVGRSCGVDILTKFCQWYPRAGDLQDNRDVPGFYLILDVPELGAADMPFYHIQAGASKRFHKEVMPCIRSEFSMSSPILDYWTDYASKAPQTDDVNDYVKDKMIHLPFRPMFARAGLVNEVAPGGSQRRLQDLLAGDGELQWPTFLVGCDLLGMVTSWTKGERRDAPNDVVQYRGPHADYFNDVQVSVAVEVHRRFLSTTPAEKEKVAKKQKSDLDRWHALHNMSCISKTAFDANHNAKAKDYIAERCMTFTRSTVLGEPGGAHLSDLDEFLSRTALSAEDLALPHKRVAFTPSAGSRSCRKCTITAGIIYSLRRRSALSDEGMDALMVLAALRDNITAKHADSSKAPFLRSVFCSVDFMPAVMKKDFAKCETLLGEYGCKDMRKIHFVLCPYRDLDSTTCPDNFIGVAVDMTTRELFYVDPRVDSADEEAMEAVAGRRMKACAKFNALLKRLFPDDPTLLIGESSIRPIHGDSGPPHAFSRCSSTHDSAIYVFAMLDYVYHCHCPIHLRLQDFVTIRRTLAVSLWRGYLPLAI